jgi:hypothetical protein
MATERSHKSYYRGYMIWKFDGYFDVHPVGDDGGNPLAEQFETREDAKTWIDEQKWFDALGNGTLNIRMN